MQQSELQKIVTEISTKLTEGHTISDVCEFMHEKFELTSEQTKEIAFEWFVSASNTPKEFLTGWCLEAYRMIFKKSLSVADFATALSCAKEIGKMAEKKDPKLIPGKMKLPRPKR